MDRDRGSKAYETALALERAEQAWNFARAGAYVAFWFWAEASPFGSWCFLGLLVGDIAAWVVLTVLAALRGKLSGLPWVLVYGALVWLWQRAGHAFALPADPEGRAVVALVFMLAFGLKVLGGVLAERLS